MHIIADFSKFSKHGGAEKNGYLFVKTFEKFSKVKVTKIYRSYDMIINLLLHLSYIKRISSILVFKNSGAIVLLANFLQIKVISRVNNSPEAYLYWGGVKSVASLWIRLFTSRKNSILVFNSRKVQHYYDYKVSKLSSYYLPNFPPKKHIVKAKDKNKIFVASRLSVEKNFQESLEFCQRNVFSEYIVDCYSSSKSEDLDIKNFGDLEIFYNDIYVSLSHFEGMPNMAIEALYRGAAIILSNNWAHAELYIQLRKFGLENRVFLVNEYSKYDQTEDLRNFICGVRTQDIKKLHNRLDRLTVSTTREYETAMQAIIQSI